MNRTIHTTVLAGVLSLTAVPAPTADAQAYCALRDPVSQIYKVCPLAKSYRSVVRTVDEATRDEITRRVPYPMHFTELGRHTLYVGLDGQRPVGLMQARSERSRWGLVEVVWAFDLDLRITGFTLQRCRARSADRQAVEGEAFHQLVRGRSFDGLLALLSDDGKALSAEAAAAVGDKPELAVAVLRCGVKTLAASAAAWRDDIVAAQRWQGALTYFPDAESLVVVDATAAPMARSEGVQMFGALGPDAAPRGVLVRSHHSFGGDEIAVWWGVAADGTLLGAHSLGTPDPLVSEALDEMRGQGLDQIDSDPECANPLKLVAAEVLLSVVPHLGGE